MTEVTWTMTGALLADIAQRDNGALLGNRRRLLGLLRDRMPVETLIVRLLMAAFDAGVPARLRSAGQLSDLQIDQEIQHLIAETGASPEFARDAVLAWARAIADYADAATGPAPAPAQVLPLPIMPVLATAPSAVAVAPAGGKQRPILRWLSIAVGVVLLVWIAFQIAVGLGLVRPTARRVVLPPTHGSDSPPAGPPRKFASTPRLAGPAHISRFDRIRISAPIRRPRAADANSAQATVAQTYDRHA